MDLLQVWLGVSGRDRCSVERFLQRSNHCMTSDPTAGVTQSLRTIVEWLADAGHACHILTTARFESRVTFTIEDHLRQQGVDVSAGASKGGPLSRPGKKRRLAGLPVVHYAVKNVPVTLLLTRHNDAVAARSCGGQAIPDAAGQAGGGFRSRSVDRVQRSPDDLRGDGERTATRRHDRVCRPRVRLLRAAILRGRRPRLHVQRVPDRRLSRQGETDEHANRAAARLVDDCRADRLARVRDLRQPVAAQGPAAVRAPRRHAGIQTAGHSNSGRAIRSQRRIAERHSGSRLQQVPANHGGAARADPGRLLRVDPHPRRALGVGRTLWQSGGGGR